MNRGNYKFYVKVAVLLVVAFAFCIVVAQSDCYYNQAARKNAMHSGPTEGKSTEELKRNIRELQRENEQHPAPVNAPVEP